jgi:hypothetical protein
VSFARGVCVASGGTLFPVGFFLGRPLFLFLPRLAYAGSDEAAAGRLFVCLVGRLVFFAFLTVGVAFFFGVAGPVEEAAPAAFACLVHRPVLLRDLGGNRLRGTPTWARHSSVTVLAFDRDRLYRVQYSLKSCLSDTATARLCRQSQPAGCFRLWWQFMHTNIPSVMVRRPSLPRRVARHTTYNAIGQHVADNYQVL